MICGECGGANEPDSRFCRLCGTPAAKRCSACAKDLPADAVFCSACGTPVATPIPMRTPAGGLPDEAVRKTVTVLFADLGGSTGFGERIDPEIVPAR